MGSVLIVFQHLKHFEAISKRGGKPAQVRKAYKESAGKYPMTREGLLEWFQMIAMGRTDFIGGLPIPLQYKPETLKLLGLPWLDPIIEGNKEGGA
jgi:hypothetical protein